MNKWIVTAVVAVGMSWGVFGAGANDLQVNIVPPSNQVGKASRTFGAEPAKAPLRVLFIGNSITLHRPLPKIGWFNDNGMAASSVDKDYVHVCAAKIEQDVPGSAFALINVAGMERGFTNENWKAEQYLKDVKGFGADIVVMFFGANVDKSYDNNPAASVRSFGDAVEECCRYLDTGKTRFYISEGFYIRPVLDDQKQATAKKLGATWVTMDDIRQRKDTHGKFNHPGDLGMQLIAERFYEVIKPALKDYVKSAK